MKHPQKITTNASILLLKGFSKREEGKLLRPATGWYSLFLVLETYRPKVLASVIEQAGVLVLDKYDRMVTATNGSKSDLESKNYALDLLASIAEELRDPGPTFSLDDERWEFEPHPLTRFGWIEGQLPDFEAYKNSTNLGGASIIRWSQRPAQEFRDELKKTGTYAKAAELHGVSRQRYVRAYNKALGITSRKQKNKSAPGVRLENAWGAPIK
jgi:hypothetical protein